MPQNKSYAVMAQRKDGLDVLDDFPTPPWATRALMEHVIAPFCAVGGLSCLEPACGAGHMSKVLSEYFSTVSASDVADYGHGVRADFLSPAYRADSFDWVITNPPFRLAEEFVHQSLPVARVGVAILARTVFLESSGRYERLFRDRPPFVFAQFVERVPMVKGRLDKTASTATGYCWLVWTREQIKGTRVVWIPPCRRSLERPADYDAPLRLTVPCVPVHRDLARPV